MGIYKIRAKKCIMKANLLGNKDVNSENKFEDLEIKKNNIDISIAYLYLYVGIIVYKHQKEYNTIDCLKFLVLFDLNYFLYITIILRK